MSDTETTIPAWYPLTPEQERAAAVAAVGPDLVARLAGVRLIVLDADGILTNGDLLYGPQGEAYKAFNAQDGLGLVLARAAGIQRAVLTGRHSAVVARRVTELHFEAAKLGRFDKADALAEILRETGCRAENTLYMGDDLIDMAALTMVAVPVTVPAAPDVVKDVCVHVTSAGGGHGAVREITDLLLRSRGGLGTALGRLQSPDWRPKAEDLSSDETE